MKSFWLAVSFLFISSQQASADQKKTEKGLLPEVRLDSEDQSVNDSKAISSEILISRTEEKAIASLHAILKKKKGSPEEADLWYRLAELYMRRSKTGRFFELQVNAQSKQLSSFPVPHTKGSDWLKKAVQIYDRLQKDFSKYSDMDSVLFNNALAHQQLGKIKASQDHYEQMVQRFPKSPLVPDALVALGELYYDQRKFSLAADFLTRLEKHKESRIFPYGMYKLAWTHYNMNQNKEGVRRLLQVVELSPLQKEGEINRNKQYLRREALRDLTIFISETTPADELVATFAKITKDDEFGQAIMDLAKLYESHSRWKDMNIFLSEFIKRYSDNVYLVGAHLSLVTASEALKKRDEVIEHLQAAGRLCVLDSKWRLQNSKEISDESCGVHFLATAKDIAEKWWEIWLKNKKHQEFTALTEKALKLIIDNEDRNRPDLKTHYAYAELLFNLERFDEASEQYKLVADKVIKDDQLKHDATYATLFSKEKAIAQLGKEKSPLKEGQRKDLALYYVKTYPKGAHAAEVHFKLAVIYYEESNYDEAEKWLKPSLSGQHGKDLQVKAQDLQMDIYNIRKDYVSIQKLTKKILAENKDSRRTENLNKILQEANYTEIQQQIKEGHPLDGAERLVQFAKEHPTSKLATDSLWQAIGIYFSEGSGTKGADAAVVFAQNNPKDSRSLESLKEAAKTYAETGYLLKAAEVLTKIADLDQKERRVHLEVVADFYALEKKYKEARTLYNSLISESDNQTKSKLFSKILTTYESKSGPEYDKVQSQIIAMNIEPYATQILFDRLKTLTGLKKESEAFDLAMKIMKRDTTPLLKAKARLVQAKILEKELVRQSIKSGQAERFALVLAMKTEKLDKAQTAFLSASKMSNDPQIQLEAFSGIDRSYANYVESLKNIQPPASISAEDRNTLMAEIGKIITQIESKRKDNSEQLRKLAKVQMSEKNNAWNLDEISSEKSLPPIVRYPALPTVQAYLPANSGFFYKDMKRLTGRTSTSCVSKKIDSSFKFHEAMATCHFIKDTKEMEKIAYSLVEIKEHRLIGLYYLSLVAELLQAYEKSLYFTELALKSRNDAPLFAYQKARMIYQIEGLTSALPFFDKVLDMQMPSTESETFAGIKAYNENDFETAKLKFFNFSADQLYNLSVGTLLSESYAQLGQLDKALKTIDDLLAKAPTALELLVQKARLIETYKMAPLLALEVYEKARRHVKDDELRNWLDRKVDLLKNQKQGRAASNF